MLICVEAFEISRLVTVSKRAICNVGFSYHDSRLPGRNAVKNAMVFSAMCWDMHSLLRPCEHENWPQYLCAHCRSYSRFFLSADQDHRHRRCVFLSGSEGVIVKKKLFIKKIRFFELKSPLTSAPSLPK